MDVTKDNLHENMEDIRNAIENSCFLSIDGEFTGITSEFNISQFDTPEEYYHKTCENSSGFILIQLGLTAFRVSDDDPEKFTYKTFNFYIYPRSKKNVFECQGESMSFLAKNGFDFNKLFREGITYCSLTEAKKLKESLLERQKQRADVLSSHEDGATPVSNNHILVPDDEKTFIENLKDQIENFLTSEDKEIIIANKNAFQRKLVYQLLEEDFFGKVSTSSRNLENNQREIVIEKKKSLEEELLIEEETKMKEIEALENHIGITNVLQIISESGKIIVGHNMLLDVLYLLKQCFGPLPEDYLDFKEFTHSIFPNLIDTKYLCTLEQFKTNINSSVLAHVYDSVTKAPFSMPKFEAESSKFAYDLNNPREHNGGYDSFLTGVCFLSLANYLKIKPNELNQNCHQLKNKINRLFLLRLFDVNHINLTGKEPQPARDHVFHVTFPSSWKQNDIVCHFRNFGSVYINWLSDNTAYVALSNREHSVVLLKTIGYTPGVKILSYKDYKELLKKKATTNHNNDTTPNKRKLNSPLTTEKERNKKIRPKTKIDTSSKTATGSTVKTFEENDDWRLQNIMPTLWTSGRRLYKCGISRFTIICHISWEYFLNQGNKFVHWAESFTTGNN